jgi:hypothetical protein
MFTGIAREIFPLSGAEFQEFKAKYNKVYDSSEENIHRFNVFVENLKIIKKLNEVERGTAK